MSAAKSVVATEKRMALAYKAPWTDYPRLQLATMKTTTTTTVFGSSDKTLRYL